MKKIGVYPGNFQPATRTHYEVYKKLQSLAGVDTFVATTDREPTPEAPLNFGDKEQIWVRHGVAASHIVKVESLPTFDTSNAQEWKPKELFSKFSAAHTVAIFVLNEKEAELFSRKKGVAKQPSALAEVLRELSENPPVEDDPQDSDLKLAKQAPDQSKTSWLKSDGSLQYFQPYKGNEHSLRPFEEHAYVVVMDDSRIQGKPISTANVRVVLGSPKYTDEQKKKFFKWVFNWFDVGLYQLMATKFRMAHQVVAPDEDPSMPGVTNIATKSVQPNLPTSFPVSPQSSRTYNPKRKLQELVHEMLKEMMDEDYGQMNSDLQASDMADTMGQTDAQQRADATQQKTSLSKQKQQAERDLKSAESDLKWKKDSVDQLRKDTIPNQRKNIDSLNKQLTDPNPTTSTTTTATSY